MPPKRTHSFEQLNLPTELMTVLDEMSITRPTDVQAEAIPVALDGKDLIAIAQTGSGKTFAFALPLLTKLYQKSTARILILTPTREMAQQTAKVFKELCYELPVSVCLLIGGVPTAKQANQLKKNPRVIVATPGRMLDHLQGNKQLLQGVEAVVIDEADRMLDIGFAPQLKLIQSTLRGSRQTLMFSASFGSSVQSLAKLFLRPNPVIIRAEQAEAPVETLRQTVLLLDRAHKLDRLLDELNRTKGSVIVFTGSQESCETVGQFLKEYGYEVDVLHGGHSQGHRNRILRDFRDGALRILVGTDLLARGLDIPEVSDVMNFDLPFQSEDFLHRIGRTARAGRGGHALTFVTPSDTKMYQRIKPYLQGAKEIKMDPKFAFIQRTKHPVRSTTKHNRK